MAANQDDIANLNKLIDEIMRESVEAVEEVQSEPQSEAEINMEQETENTEGEEQHIEQRAKKRQRITEPTEDDQAFISDEAHGLWKKVYFDKSFMGERGFGKLVSLFSEAIERRGWGLFCEHKAPGFAAMVRESYANLVGMREDNTVFVRGVWVPFGAQKINEVFNMKDLKHGSKFKKMVEKPNHGKILHLLIAGRGKWEATKKDSHHSISRGSLTKEVKVWFYFLTSVIVPIKHLSSVKEQEAMILYALLKGYKINIGSLIEESIKGYHASNKRGLIPHPTTITRLCILARVKGVCEEEEKCPRVSPLTLTGVTRGPKGKKQKEVVAADKEAEQEVNEENNGREIEKFPDNTIPEMTKEEPIRVSPIIHFFL